MKGMTVGIASLDGLAGLPYGPKLTFDGDVDHVAVAHDLGGLLDVLLEGQQRAVDHNGAEAIVYSPHNGCNRIAVIHVEDKGCRAIGDACDHIFDKVVFAIVKLSGMHRDDRRGIVRFSSLDDGAEEVRLGDVVGTYREVMLSGKLKHLVHIK